MLNRRTLRIKAMQTMFAYRQSREANYAIALQQLDELFSPDLNSMGVQDKEELKLNKILALDAFKRNYKNEQYQPTSNQKVDEVVIDTIKLYYQQNAKDKKHYEKLMVAEAEKITDHYLLILLLLIKFAELAESDTKLDHSKFVKNLLIKAIKFNKSIETTTLRKNLSWANESVRVRGWFKDLVKSDDGYQKYLTSEEQSFEEDKAIILHLAKIIISKKEVIDIYMEENDLSWEENRAIVKSLVVKTIKSINELDNDDFKVQELSYNWEDDKTFFKQLFMQTFEVEKQYEPLIADKTKNWDIERIATTDKIMIEMAIAEMINFPSIPVKVTINEYIEVAKRYSTPKSKIFINGILDVIAGELENLGVIKKSGRGLIDNK